MNISASSRRVAHAPAVLAAAERVRDAGRVHGQRVVLSGRHRAPAARRERVAPRGRVYRRLAFLPRYTCKLYENKYIIY